MKTFLGLTSFICLIISGAILFVLINDIFELGVIDITLTSAVQEIVVIAGSALFAIFARIAQAEVHHIELMAKDQKVEDKVEIKTKPTLTASEQL